jgi:hypothetical protein
MSEEMKACPFCGNQFNTGHKDDCYFRMRGKSEESREKAWQNRPIEDALQSALTTAQEENKRLYKLHCDAVDMHNKQIEIALKSCSNLREENKRYKDALESSYEALSILPSGNVIFDRLTIQDAYGKVQSALNGGK